ncbi:MAG TPA: sigma-70 family RNA polymerase sigma factor [Kofleriaceae bacterium]|jgi:RNA polymerase sigma-70 factor (ECF subfamily)
MDPTDGELLERWRAGDSESGEALFERYYDILERFFVNKLNDAVPDLVQDTFTRCVQNHDRIRDDQFRLYLFGIAYNVLKEHLRARYRGGTPLDMSQASVYDLAPGPVTLVVRRREHRLLLEALRTIPIEDQVILELHYWENLTTDDIAEVLGIPVGTARGRLQRAREKLGEVMQRLTESSQDLTTTVASLEGWAKECRDHLDSYLSRG